MRYGIVDSGEIIAEFAVPLTVESNKPSYVNDSLSLKRSTKKRTVQRWEFQTRLVPQTFDANNIFVHMLEHGDTVPFDVVAPQNIGVIKKRVLNDADPKITLTGVAGEDTIDISAGTHFLPKGTLISKDTSAKRKTYALLEDYDGTAPATVRVYPNLHADHTAEGFNVGDNVLMHVYYDTTVVRGMRYEDGILQDPGKLLLIEAL